MSCLPECISSSLSDRVPPHWRKSRKLQRTKRDSCVRRAQTHTHTRTPTHTHPHPHPHPHTHTHTHTLTQTHTHTHAQTHRHRHTHARTHTHTLSLSNKGTTHTESKTSNQPFSDTTLRFFSSVAYIVLRLLHETAVVDQFISTMSCISKQSTLFLFKTMVKCQ